MSDQDPFIRGESFVYVAPVGTPFPPGADLGCLSDERWELLYPSVPDYPPEESENDQR